MMIANIFAKLAFSNLCTVIMKQGYVLLTLVPWDITWDYVQSVLQTEFSSVGVCTPEPEAGPVGSNQSLFGSVMVKTFFFLLLVAGLCKGDFFVYRFIQRHF